MTGFYMIRRGFVTGIYTITRGTTFIVAYDFIIWYSLPKGTYCAFMNGAENY
jgi:hypothetical protein